MRAPIAIAPIVDHRAFILANTRLQRPPHTPELVLHLADEVTPIWRMTEEELDRIGAMCWSILRPCATVPCSISRRVPGCALSPL
jgi:predicted nicotinamide N-methyase